MKMILTYTVTEKLLDRFSTALRMQATLFPDAIADCELAVFTDKFFDRALLPFSEQITVHAFDDLWKGKDFWMARAQNHALDYCVGRDADWIGMLSADCFVMELPEKAELPASGFSAWRVWLQDNDRSRLFSVEETMAAHGNEQMWHLLHHRVFSNPQCRLDEQYFGYGSEDVDFSANILPKFGFPEGKSCGKLFHLWHPKRDHSRIAINEERFYSKQQAR